MADISQFIDKDYEEIDFKELDFKELADSPVEALQGLSADDANVLRKNFGINTIRELAENKFVRIAQAIVAMSSVAVLQEARGGAVTLRYPWNPTGSDKRRTNAVEQKPDFKDLLLAAPDFEILEIYRSNEPARSVELQ